MNVSLALSPAFADSAVIDVGNEPQRDSVIGNERHSRPSSYDIYLYGRISENLEIISPLQVTMEQQEDTSFVVADDIFLVYGTGDQRESAMKEYANSLWEYYALVSASAESDPFDRLLLEKLNQYILIS